MHRTATRDHSGSSDAVPHGACRIEGAERTVGRTVGEGFHSTQHIALGRTGTIRQEEGRILEAVHRLPGPQQGYRPEQVSFAKD